MVEPTQGHLPRRGKKTERWVLCYHAERQDFGLCSELGQTTEKESFSKRPATIAKEKVEVSS